MTVVNFWISIPPFFMFQHESPGFFLQVYIDSSTLETYSFTF